ncbi:hypothetical protein [Streptomyces sp. H72]
MRAQRASPAAASVVALLVRVARYSGVAQGVCLGGGAASEAPCSRRAVGGRAAPDDLSFVKRTTSPQVAFLTAELLAEQGHGSRPDISAGAGCSITVGSY